jgi:hypothetical protein
MMAGCSAAIQRFGAIVAAMLLVAAAAPTSAQTIANPTRPAAAKSSKPATQRAPVKTGTEQGTDYWAINTDVGKYANTSRDIDRTAATTRERGRVPLQTGQGSVGFASDTVKSGQFSDGRAVPGMDRYTQDPQTYVGLSLSVPSNNNSFPLPGLPMPRNDW